MPWWARQWSSASPVTCQNLAYEPMPLRSQVYWICLARHRSDTAALYGNGESERNLGRVLKALKANVVVGTKVRLSAEHRADVGKAIEQGMNDSLGRMGRDHVDLFQLHNPLVAKDAGDHLAID